ncbi:MAG: hypothetical protein LBF51_01965, partial [Zoogloeaceae bacterium]|nr:hypothetical protein [Zoogloeaceae bacterium]
MPKRRGATVSGGECGCPLARHLVPSAPWRRGVMEERRVTMHWHLIHTKIRLERRALENLERQGYECYLPL